MKMVTEHDWLQVHEQATVKYLGARADDNLMPPSPQVPSNVTEVGLPTMSASVDVYGTTLDYLPVAVYIKNCPVALEFGTQYPMIGIMTPDGDVVQRYQTKVITPGSLSCVWMFDPKSELGIETSIRQKLYWNRVSQSLIPEKTPHTTSVSVTSGITETEGESLSFSIGAKVGFSKVITADLSSTLTKSFSHQVSITNQTSVTEQFAFPEKPVKQVVGIYQVNQTFSIYAGANLANYVANLNAHPALGSWYTFKAEMPFIYPGSSYLQVSGTDSPSALETKHMLSPEAIDVLVKNSLPLE